MNNYEDIATRLYFYNYVCYDSLWLTNAISFCCDFRKRIMEKIPVEQVSVDAEIKTLNNENIGHCKVIRDIGDYAYVVGVKDIQGQFELKFQLEGAIILYMII